MPLQITGQHFIWFILQKQFQVVLNSNEACANLGLLFVHSDLDVPSHRICRLRHDSYSPLLLLLLLRQCWSLWQRRLCRFERSSASLRLAKSRCCCCCCCCCCLFQGRPRSTARTKTLWMKKHQHSRRMFLPFGSKKTAKQLSYSTNHCFKIYGHKK